MADESAGPTVQRILLGHRLRRLREAKEISPDEAADEIRASNSKISRIELGRSPVKRRDIEDLLTLYGVTEPGERAELLHLAAQASTAGWWHRYNDVLPEWMQRYVGFEEAAKSIRTYESQFIPGLLQTEGYAAALMALADCSAAQAERRVALRKQRQCRFLDGSLYLWAIIDEAALLRRVGGAEVMSGQLRHLLAATKRPNLTLQITPLVSDGHATAGGFSIFRFGDPEMTDIVYTEQLTSALYLEKRPDVDAYMLNMERLTIVSHSPRRSAEMIQAILDRTPTS